MSKSSNLVYSTETGRIKPQSPSTPRPTGDGIVRIWKSSKGRGGKTVSVITGLALEPTELGALGKQLKQLCGTGGTLKDGNIEIQGDHRDKLKAALEARGLNVKLAGG